ncbi:MAG: DUF1552 domain-containing protein [Myxococcota bacterium]
MTRLKRRAFLGGLGVAGGALAARPFVGRHLTSAQPMRAPTRLLIIHKPCGTVPADYDPSGGERDFTLSPILAPFEDVRQHMVILEGMDIRKKPRTPGQDHGNCMVTFMTGGVTVSDPAFDAVIAEKISIDQILANDETIRGDTPIPSLQLSADLRSDRNEVFTRVLSYSGRASPLGPEQRPAAAFARAFGNLMDGGGGPDAVARLERARAQKRSVLDFARGSIQRLQQNIPGDQQDKLESHLDAVRELETSLDDPRRLGAMCSEPTELRAIAEAVDPDVVNDQHGPIGRAHLDIIRTAFQCDLTRIATFGWAAGNSHINFSRLIDVENRGHHNITHSGNNRAHDESAIHLWYCEQMAEMVRSFRDTPDIDGRSLLDNTLIVVFSEIRLGRHSFDNVPIQLFGGAGGRLEGNRKLSYDSRSTNDLWVAISNMMGHPMERFGDDERNDAPLEGLFSPA